MIRKPAVSGKIVIGSPIKLPNSLGKADGFNMCHCKKNFVDLEVKKRKHLTQTYQPALKEKNVIYISTKWQEKL